MSTICNKEDPKAIPSASNKDDPKATPTATISKLTGKRKKIYKPKSLVWEHFLKIQNDDGSEPTHCRCKYCSSVFGCLTANGTKSLWRHLEKCNKYPYSSTDKKQSLLSFGVGQSSVSNWRFDQEICRKELARMIIIDELPFNFVEKEGFRRFMSVVQPRFQVVSRKTIRKDCMEIFSSEKIILKEVFAKSISQICLTTDLWTSVQNLGYMCLTAHFITDGWELQKKIINFQVLPTPHRGENIAQAVETCLLEWGIEKVLTITVDNASSNDVAVASLKSKLNRRKKLILDGEMFHMRCFGHILNLIVRDGIEEAGDSILRIRDSVKYVRSSPSRLQIFNKCVEEERITSKKSLCLDVQTRWNSTYLMLSAAIEYQKVFERLEDKDVNFLIEVERKHGVPTEKDWEMVKNLHKFLAYFFDMTHRVSGSRYVTSNSYFHEVYALQSIFLKWSQSEDSFLRDMTIRMKAKFEKYCNIHKINSLLIIAVILDPRYKLVWVEFCFLKFYSSSEVETLISNVKKVLERLFDSYSKDLISCESNPKNVQSESTITTGTSESNIFLNESHLDWNNFLQKKESGVMKSELNRYLEDSIEKISQDFDILGWWKEHCGIYRILAHMARDILAIPVSTVASESAFSVGGRILDSFRSSLTPQIVECLICGQDWLRSSSTPIEVEEKLEELERTESGITDANTNANGGVSGSAPA